MHRRDQLPVLPLPVSQWLDRYTVWAEQQIPWAPGTLMPSSRLSCQSQWWCLWQGMQHISLSLGRRWLFSSNKPLGSLCRPSLLARLQQQPVWWGLQQCWLPVWQLWLQKQGKSLQVSLVLFNCSRICLFCTDLRRLELILLFLSSPVQYMKPTVSTTMVMDCVTKAATQRSVAGMALTVR